MMRVVSIFVLLACLAPSATAQDGTPFDRVMAEARSGDWQELSFGMLMQRVGSSFLGSPYEAGLLDRHPEERLVAPLDRFDCVLFVESVLALSRGIAVGALDRASFEQRIEEQRYRDGSMDGYCSRLHYFSEWILDNEARGLVRNVTRDLDGVRLDRRLDFMGRHRDAYPMLADDSLYAGILAMEDRLADLELYYVPQDRIASVADRLQAGDIVALATRVDGLDVSHTGLVYVDDEGRRGLLHASLDRGVIVSPDLGAYVEGNPSQIGIVVARPQDPRGL